MKASDGCGSGALSGPNVKVSILKMTVLGRLCAFDVAKVMKTYAQALKSHQEALNRLNVYPVPDGDTGTNMVLTLESVVADLALVEGMEVLDAFEKEELDGETPKRRLEILSATIDGN